jgi:cell wall-associated NlpC family hydrolase
MRSSYYNSGTIDMQFRKTCAQRIRKKAVGFAAKSSREKVIYIFPEITTWFRSLASLNLAFLTIFILATSCATQTRPQTINTLKIERTPEKANIYSDSREIEKRIRDEYMRWKGTRHRYGGTGRDGIDCSGFVQAVYKNIFKVELPRTTKELMKQGILIGRDDLQAGDLVFFKPPNYPDHVGIYLSRKEFVHASKKRGVTISQIDLYYWGRCYWTARRIFFK